MFLNWHSRFNELEADAYAVRLGYHKELSNSLVRNFAQNNDLIYVSKIQEWIGKSHPSLLDRLDAIEKHVTET